MKADLTRSTFDAKRHLRSVRMQQGRVQLDADWNEQQDIHLHREAVALSDLVGDAGVPEGDAFRIEEVGGELTVHAGRCFVDGWVCENEADVVLTAQPDWPGSLMPLMPAGSVQVPLPPAPGQPVFPPPPKGRYLAYLEVWPRHLTALELPDIREVALGGPDTATREKTVWQVKLMPTGNAQATCGSRVAQWTDVTKPPTGRMAARSQPGGNAANACELDPAADYTRLENLLYRVEVHAINGAAVRFKWSRDNGSITTKVLDWFASASSNELEVASIGRDERLSISAGCWIEISDERRDLTGHPGTLVRVESTSGNLVRVDRSSAVGSLDAAQFDTERRVRRWDGIFEHTPPTAANTWLLLEQQGQPNDGVQVRFDAGTWRVGDYWQFAARMATGTIEWPQENSAPKLMLPHGVPRGFMRLAICHWSGSDWTVVEDCRRQFPPLTDLVNLYYAGGDGQEVAPKKTGATSLGSPLSVVVLNGSRPVRGALVRFTAESGNFDAQPGPTTFITMTDSQGNATATWFLDPGLPKQRARAELLDSAGKVGARYASVQFTGSLSIASQVDFDAANCPDLLQKNVLDVQKAIEELYARPSDGGCCVTVGATGRYRTLKEALDKEKPASLCLCLLPGEHDWEDSAVVHPAVRHLALHGSGRGTRLQLHGRNLQFSELGSLRLADLDIVSAKPANVHALRCTDIELRHVHLKIAHVNPDDCPVRLEAHHRVEVASSVLLAFDGQAVERSMLVADALSNAKFVDWAAAFTNEDNAFFSRLEGRHAPNDESAHATWRQPLRGAIESLLQSNQFETETLRLLEGLMGLAESAAFRAVQGAIEALRDAVLMTGDVIVAAGDFSTDVVVRDSTIGGGFVIGTHTGGPLPRLTEYFDIMTNTPQNVVLGPGQGRVQLINNQVCGLFVKAAMLQAAEVDANAGGRIDQYPAMLTIDGNTVVADISALFARSLTFNGNMLLAMTESNTHVHATAVQARYVGNFGLGGVAVIHNYDNVDPQLAPKPQQALNEPVVVL